MARPERFELPTYSSGGCRSIQLSYGRVPSVYMQTADAIKPGCGERGNSSVSGRLPAASTSAAAFAITSTTTAARSLGFRTRLVHVQRATTQLSSVQSGDCAFCFFRIGHLYESESSRAPSLPVGHNTYAVDLSVRFKHLAQLILGCIEVEISYKDVFQAGASDRSYLNVSFLRQEQVVHPPCTRDRSRGPSNAPQV
jgi:hypothetical protein